MKALLKKISCLLISCIMFACPIFNNVNYHNSLLEVNASETFDWLDPDSILVIFLASLGLTVSGSVPNLPKFLGDKFRDFIRKYDEVTQNQLQEAYMDMKAREGEPIFEIPPILYNAFNEFLSNINKDTPLSIGKDVDIYSYTGYGYYQGYNGLVATNNKNGLLNDESSYYLYVEVPSYVRMVISHTSSGLELGFCSNQPFNYKYSTTSYPTINFLNFSSNVPSSSGYYISSLSSRSDYLPLISYFSDLNIYNNSNNILKYTYGLDGTISGTIEDKVIGNADLNLDDRVLSTDQSATLDLTKIKNNILMGDNTIEDISKWLSGVLSTDRTWGTSIPLPNVIPIPTSEPIPTNEPIPTSEPLPTATPFPPGEIENYQTPSLTNVFPFCVPYDVVKFFGVLNAEPQAPKWTFDLNNFSEGYKLTIDMKDYETIIVVFRYGMLGLFIVGLILITRYIVGGQ